MNSPEILIRLAPQVEVGLAYRDRLLNDQRMRNVWRQVGLQARKQIASDRTDFSGRLETVPSQFKIATWWRDDSPVPLDPIDRALGAVFLAAVTEFAGSNPAPHLEKIEKEVGKWRFGAALCGEARQTSHRGEFDHDLFEALERVGAYFAERANLIDRAKTGDGVIARSRETSGRGDDARRGQVQRIARTMVSLFGSPLAGTLAKLINVARSLPKDAQVTAKDVENWCSKD